MHPFFILVDCAHVCKNIRIRIGQIRQGVSGQGSSHSFRFSPVSRYMYTSAHMLTNTYTKKAMRQRYCSASLPHGLRIILISPKQLILSLSFLLVPGRDYSVFTNVPVSVLPKVSSCHTRPGSSSVPTKPILPVPLPSDTIASSAAASVSAVIPAS